MTAAVRCSPPRVALPVIALPTKGVGSAPTSPASPGALARDLLESIVVPSKVISDQYEAVTIQTADGRVITGRIVNLNGDGLSISPDMFDPNRQIAVKRSDIEEITRSPVSMMPEGLLNTLKSDEVLDLMAYLLSRGDRQYGDVHGKVKGRRPESAKPGRLSQRAFPSRFCEHFVMISGSFAPLGNHRVVSKARRSRIRC